MRAHPWSPPGTGGTSVRFWPSPSACGAVSGLALVRTRGSTLGSADGPLAPWLLVGLASVGCGSKRFVAEERWAEAPELRGGGAAPWRSAAGQRGRWRHAAQARSRGDAPDRGGTEIWLFAYRRANLEERFPGLVGADAQAMLEALSPTADPGGTEARPADEVLLATLDAGATSPLSYRSKTWRTPGRSGLG